MVEEKVHEFELPEACSLEERFAKPEQLVKTYEDYAKNNPNEASAHIILARCYIRQILHIQSEVVECYERALELDQNRMGQLDYHNLGVVYKRLGNNEKAKECFEKAKEYLSVAKHREAEEIDKEIKL